MFYLDGRAQFEVPQNKDEKHSTTSALAVIYAHQVGHYPLHIKQRLCKSYAR